MIAFDTNVLVRLLARDEPTQARRARRTVESADASGGPILINDIVLAETLWTMGRTFKASRAELLDMAQALYEVPTLAFESRDTVARAIGLFTMSSADFSDCLIVAKNDAAGCRETLTFDLDCSRLPSARAL